MTNATPGARRGNKATNKRQQQHKLKSGKPKSHRHYKLVAQPAQKPMQQQMGGAVCGINDLITVTSGNETYKICPFESSMKNQPATDIINKTSQFQFINQSQTGIRGITKYIIFYKQRGQIIKVSINANKKVEIDEINNSNYTLEKNEELFQEFNDADSNNYFIEPQSNLASSSPNPVAPTTHASTKQPSSHSPRIPITTSQSSKNLLTELSPPPPRPPKPAQQQSYAQEQEQATSSQPTQSDSENREVVINTEGVYDIIDEQESIDDKTLKAQFNFLHNKYTTFDVVDETYIERTQNSKNRYGDMRSGKISQVIIRPNSEKDDDKYINASYINLPTPYNIIDNKFEYIATQCPIPTTVNDFWQMIWENKTEVICMLTKLVESGKLKCSAYINFGDLENQLPAGRENNRNSNIKQNQTNYLIENIGTIYCDDAGKIIDNSSKTHSIEIRLLQITNKIQNDKDMNKSRIVKHIFYRNWPDQDVPNNQAGILLVSKLINLLTIDKNGNRIQPVIHCSAGVGRTGTLIAINYILNNEELNSNDITTILPTQSYTSEEEPMDLPFRFDMLSKKIFDIMDTMRKQRTLMIQKESQYPFIYHSIKNYINGQVILNEQEEQEELVARSILDSNADSIAKTSESIISRFFSDKLAELEKQMKNVNQIYSEITNFSNQILNTNIDKFIQLPTQADISKIQAQNTTLENLSEQIKAKIGEININLDNLQSYDINYSEAQTKFLSEITESIKGINVILPALTTNAKKHSEALVTYITKIIKLSNDIKKLKEPQKLSIAQLENYATSGVYEAIHFVEGTNENKESTIKLNLSGSESIYENINPKPNENLEPIYENYTDNKSRLTKLANGILNHINFNSGFIDQIKTKLASFEAEKDAEIKKCEKFNSDKETIQSAINKNISQTHKTKLNDLLAKFKNCNLEDISAKFDLYLEKINAIITKLESYKKQKDDYITQKAANIMALKQAQAQPPSQAQPHAPAKPAQAQLPAPVKPAQAQAPQTSSNNKDNLQYLLIRNNGSNNYVYVLINKNDTHVIYDTNKSITLGKNTFCILNNVLFLNNSQYYEFNLNNEDLILQINDNYNYYSQQNLSEEYIKPRHNIPTFNNLVETKHKNIEQLEYKKYSKPTTIGNYIYTLSNQGTDLNITYKLTEKAVKNKEKLDKIQKAQELKKKKESEQLNRKKLTELFSNKIYDEGTIEYSLITQIISKAKDKINNNKSKQLFIVRIYNPESEFYVVKLKYGKYADKKLITPIKSNSHSNINLNSNQICLLESNRPLESSYLTHGFTGPMYTLYYKTLNNITILKHNFDDSEVLLLDAYKSLSKITQINPISDTKHPISKPQHDQIEKQLNELFTDPVADNKIYLGMLELNGIFSFYLIKNNQEKKDYVKIGPLCNGGLKNSEYYSQNMNVNDFILCKREHAFYFYYRTDDKFNKGIFNKKLIGLFFDSKKNISDITILNNNKESMAGGSRTMKRKMQMATGKRGTMKLHSASRHATHKRRPKKLTNLAANTMKRA